MEQTVTPSHQQITNIHYNSIFQRMGFDEFARGMLILDFQTPAVVLE
jgi:hypothetical protein